MRKYFALLATLVLTMGVVLSCGEKTDDVKDFDVQFTVPESITLNEGDTDLTFKVLFKKAPQQSDVIVFTDPAGSTHDCAIKTVSDNAFTVSLFEGIYSGSYKVSVRRGGTVKQIGTTYITVNSGDVKPENGATVYGVVSCEGKPLRNVVVSDGVEVVVTNDKGVYQMKSAKKYGYVFVSVPSGYEAPTQGVLPQLYSLLTEKSNVPERRDFALIDAGDQTTYKMLFFGDMHLANRTNDVSQFRVFTSDLNAFREKHSAERIYGMTLGDMTWDQYWYDNHYSFQEYLETINGDVKGLTIFHTMGNHDNNFLAIKPDADLKAADEYVQHIAPTFYSFNIGKIHYVVVDDIDCSDYDGTKSRNYVKRLTSDQIDWLEKDLSHVSKSTPLVITTHAQIFYPNGVSNFKLDHSNTDQLYGDLFQILKDYTVHFVTGHTHLIFNATPTETSAFGLSNCYEHNAGSVCGSWWWSGNLTSGVYVGQDGSPAGYSIWDINGTDIKWQYKATAWDESYQFRSYDLNQISFSMDDVPLMPKNNAELTSAFGKYVSAYPANSNNEVLINIWNWNSKWKLSVTDEKGNELNWTKTVAYDPLHISALSVKRFNKASLSSVPSFITENRMPHFFKVKAADADTDLTIKVTDEFGNVYTENMARPKAYRVEDFSKR